MPATESPRQDQSPEDFSLFGRLRRSRPLLLLAAILLHIVLGPQLSSIWLRLGLQAAIALAAVSLAADTTAHRRVSLALAAPGLACMAAAAATHNPFWDWAAFALLMALYVHVIRLMLRRIFMARRVTLDEIGLALCAYVLLGVVWVMFYLPLATVAPDAFVFNVPVEPDGMGYAMLYFSYVTLTTLGYGDIVPVSDLARSLAVVEALTGVLFLAVLISRLVGTYSARRD